MKILFDQLRPIKWTVAVVLLILLILTMLLRLSGMEKSVYSDLPIIRFHSFDPHEELILKENHQYLQLDKTIEYLTDSNNILKLEDVISDKMDHQFKPLWKEGLSSENSSGHDSINPEIRTIWVRMTIEKVFSGIPILLTTASRSTILTSYIPDKYGSYHLSKRRIEETWRYFSNDPEIYVLLPRDMTDNTHIYIKMEARKNKKIELDFTALTQKTHTNDFSKDFHSKGIFVGFFLAILIFHIFLYINTQEEKYYYYILFIFFLMINRMISTQITLWKLWAGMCFIKSLIDSLVLAGLQICGLHFIRKLLTPRYDTKRISQLNRISNTVYIICILWALISGIMILPFTIKQNINALLIGINMILAYYYLIHSIRQGNKTAILYMLAFFPFILSEFMYVFTPSIYNYLQILFPDMDIRYLVDIIQCTVLASAIGQDIVRYRREKEISDKILRDRLQNENKYLEKKVETRTKDLKEASRNAEYANIAKSRFLANISHELRTPLGGIIGFAELINKTDNRNMQRQYNQKILTESEHLLNLISDVLNLSKIESGVFEIESSAFILKKKLDESLAGQKMLIKEKGLSFQTHISENLPEIVIGDHHRLRQILLNLVNNARKFTNRGFVRIVVQPVMPTTENLALIRFEVQDSGIGIPEQLTEKIFQSFVQVDLSPSRNHEGTGLGTSISKKLVELMGGEIGYTPNTPQGSIFWFTIPFTIGSEDLLRNNVPQDPVPGKGDILIIDDYETNREIVSTHLKSIGYSTELAENGYKAIKQCRGKHYDLLLMDIQMPMLNGYDAVDRIVNECPLNARTPVLMLTAGGFNDDLENIISSNIKGVIYKPVQLNAISVQISEILNPKALENNTREQTRTRLDSIEAFLEQFEDRIEGKEIIREYLNNCLKDMETLNDLIIQKDFQTLHRTVHSMKGGALNIGMPDLAEISKKIENFIKINDLFRSGIDQEAINFLNSSIMELKNKLSEIRSDWYSSHTI